MLVWDRTHRFPISAPSEWLLLFPAAVTKQLCPTSTETQLCRGTEGSHCARALIGTGRNSHGLPPGLSLQEYSDVKHFFFQRAMVVWNWHVSESVSKSGDLCPVCTSRLMGWDSGLDFQNVLTNGLLERGISLVLSQAGRAAGKQLFEKFLVQRKHSK